MKAFEILIYKCALKGSMVIKSLTITEEAYDSLKRLKYGDESFSEVIIRVAKEKKPNLEKYFGILKQSETKAEDWIKRIKEGREKFNASAKERSRKLTKIGG